MSLKAMFLGGERFWSKDLHEASVRATVIFFLIAPPLFALVENAPTTWGILYPIAILPALLYVRPRLPRINVLAVLIVACLLAALSATWSIAPERSLNAAVIAASYLAGAVVAIWHLSSLTTNDADRVWRAVRIGAIVGLAILVVLEVRADPGNVITIRTFHKITFYQMLAMSVLLFEARSGRPLYWVAFAVFGVFTLAFGRTTGINFLIVFVGLICFLPDRWIRRILVGFVATYILLTLLAPYIVSPAYTYLDQSGYARFGSGTFAARLELWNMISGYIGETWFWGHGADTVRTAEYVVQKPKYYTLPDLPSAHNIVFDLWFELGLAGAALWSAVIGVTAAAILRLSGPALLSCTALLLTIVVELSVDHRVWLSWLMGAVIFAACIGVLAVRRGAEQTAGTTTSLAPTE